ncbi:RDD family protein [Streptomyces sp. NPDC006326]|uniref:RDD family protein n=1 Tax=Streptomyces sp. NPDC006326 TaxID=3156752 RepID=UPI0033A33EE6
MGTLTASPGDGEHAAREGYYPDPSIPGYVRYWNGLSWVPGTSRPATPADETGPVFLDRTGVTEVVAERAPAAAWQADPAQQAGFGGSRDDRVSWGHRAEPERDPKPKPKPEPEPEAEPEPVAERGPGVSFARAGAGTGAARGSAEGVGILSARSPAAESPAWPSAPGGGSDSGLTSSWPEAREAPRPQRAEPGPWPPSGQPAPNRAAPDAPPWPSSPDRPAPDEAGARQAAHAEVRAEIRAAEPAPAGPRGTGTWAPERPAPTRPGPEAGGARPAAGGGERDEREPRDGESAPRGAVPWTPRQGPAAGGPLPAEPPADRPEAEGPAPARHRPTGREVFEQMAERAVRPAGLARRAVARALDSLVLAAVAAAAARPLLPAATAHLRAKVDAARGTGHTTTVWLFDGTVAGYLGLVLAAVLLFGVFYEALPTARWGRTPGKKLLGIRVLAAATLRPPGFGAALRRWLVFALFGLLGSLWCLGDRPRRRGWHDRAARTYVSR